MFHSLAGSGLKWPQNNFNRDFSLQVKPPNPELIHSNLSSAAV